MTNEIVWKKIYEKVETCHYIGTITQTFEAQIKEGKIIRHTNFHVNDGDESNRTETMVFVPVQE